MKNNFISDSPFGCLTFKSIYEFFEEPRFFSVTNEVGSLFLVYWIGDEEDFDKWYIFPVSKGRLELLERKRIDINSCLVHQEQKSFVHANLPYDDKDSAKFETKNTAEITNLIKLPKPNLFISGVTPVLETGKLGKPVGFSTHEIHIEKSTKSHTDLELNGISKVFERFDDFYSSILNAAGEKDKMKPVSARPGSFILAFQAEKMHNFEYLLRNLFEQILYKRDLSTFIKNNNIDVQVFATLLRSVIETNTKMELKNNDNDEVIFTLHRADADFYIQDIAKMASQYVSGEQVPQANILDKVFKIVELKWQAKQLNFQSTGLEERHIFYYVRAAKVLGFLDENGAVTVSGQQLVESDEVTKLKLTARSFESSHCGWAWVNWSNASDIRGINPDTAEEFLLAKGLALSASTLNRRSSTLKQWCEILQKNYVAY